jgi:predicted RNA-binding Zn ribbon-like protein
VTGVSARNVPGTAPGSLAVVQQFFNTLHVEKSTDALADAETAYEWLVGTMPGGTRARPDAADLDRLRALRRELRALCGDGAPDAGRFAEVAGQAPLRAELDAAGQVTLVPCGADATVATLLAIVLEAQRDGTWRRLKICRHDGCRWAFYDRSRSHTGTWCAMGVCGNRTKVAAYRRRHLPA